MNIENGKGRWVRMPYGKLIKFEQQNYYGVTGVVEEA